MRTDVVLKDQWSERANTFKNTEPPTQAQFISTNGGQFRLGEDELGDEIVVIVLDAVRENTYYDEAFDPDNVTPPQCYAFGRTEEEMAPPFEEMDKNDPNEEWFDPQSESCQGCPMAEWGSARTGRGKACTNRRRLALLPAGFIQYNRKTKESEMEIFDDEDHYASSDVAFLKLPPTSLKNWAKYVREVANTFQRPPYGVFTRVYIEADKKTQFQVHFEVIEEVDDEMAALIMQRADDAAANIITHYRPPEEQPRKRGGINRYKKGKR